MLIYKTNKSNEVKDSEFEKFEDYREYKKDKTARLNEVVRGNLMPQLYDYVFGKTDENPMYSVAI